MYIFCSLFFCVDTLNVFVQGISVVLPIENQMTKPQVLNDDDNNVDDVGIMMVIMELITSLEFCF